MPEPGRARDLHQHDLTPEAAAGFVATAGVRKRDRVFEAGPGTGALTAALLATGARVHAVELDPERVRGLEARFAAEIGQGRLSVRADDAAAAAPDLGGAWRVVANPPFNRSADLLRHWLLGDFAAGPPWALDVVIQYQTAQKWTPGPELTHASALVALAGSAKISKKIARDAVTPPSHVPLSGWSWRRDKAAPPPADLRAADAALKLGFSGVHTMAQALRGRLSAEQIRRHAAEHGWSPDDHPRTLGASDWLHLGRFLHTIPAR